MITEHRDRKRYIKHKSMSETINTELATSSGLLLVATIAKQTFHNNHRTEEANLQQ